MNNILDRINDKLDEMAKGDFAGWVAMYGGKRIEITKDQATDLYGAKQLAIKQLKVPKSKQGLLAIKLGYEE